MRQFAHLSFASIFFAALLPVTVWAYDFSGYPDNRSYRPYTGSAGGNHYPGSLRVQRGMTGDGYYVRAYFEGLRPEDVQVYLRRNHLVLQIAQGDQYRRHNPDARRLSRWKMRFRRQWRLPYDADWTRMTTNTKNGIMDIHIPRRSQYMPTGPSLNLQK
jgi:HSP20 family molecular chaperone IbpA